MENSPIICAIDCNDLNQASDWIGALNGEIQYFKLGLEFFSQFGKAGIQKLQIDHKFNLFLDLKFHDIPHTVAGAVNSVKDLNPRFLTVHATGGREMIGAAAKAAPEIEITAVTLLTSLSENDLNEIGISGSASLRAAELANLSIAAGAKAIVTSPMEVNSIREKVGEDPILITPGVRPLDASSDDQKRVMDPKNAMKMGANYLVIGRPITSYASTNLSEMRNAAKRINDSLA